MLSPKLNIVTTCIFLLFLFACGQLPETNFIPENNEGIYVYNTPHGEKYHTAQCHMVDNTSNGILLDIAIQKGLTPCSFCKPDINLNRGTSDLSYSPKPGKKAESTRCLGMTMKREQCKHSTKNANGYCYQHAPKMYLEK